MKTILTLMTLATAAVFMSSCGMMDGMSNGRPRSGEDGKAPVQRGNPSKL